MFFRPQRRTSIHEHSGKERVSEHNRVFFGLFEFQQMPFGLKNADAACCRLLQAVVDDVNNPGGGVKGNSQIVSHR